MTFLLTEFLPMLPIVVLWLVYFCSIAVFLKKEWLGRFISMKVLIVSTIVFRVIYAGLLSVTQYYVWYSQEFTKLLINSPLGSEVPLSNFLRGILGPVLDSNLGYFLFYSWGRFWIGALLSIFIAFCFYAFLRALRKYNDRFFYKGEIELGLLLALVVGWPNFVVFVPLIFLAVVLVSIFRGIYFKEAYTTLGAPMLLAALLTMIFGSSLIKFLGLAVLKI